MGAYLSEPVTTKESEDKDSAELRVGLSSMQGWRVAQEDAHNAILDFDEDTSLFGVYDGHGGPEVSLYMSQKYPDCLKQNEFYTKNNLEEALKQSFLQFDKSIKDREVMAVLEVLAGKNPTEEDEHDLKELDSLCKDATKPLEEVLRNLGREEDGNEDSAESAEQSGSSSKPSLISKRLRQLGEEGSADKKAISPFLRAKTSPKTSDEQAGSSASSSERKPSLEFDEIESDPKIENENKSNGEKSEEKEVKTESKVINGHATNGAEEKLENGDEEEDKKEEEENVSTKGKGKGKGKGKSNKIIQRKTSEDQEEEEEQPIELSKAPKPNKKSAMELYSMFRDDEVMDEEDSEEEDEEQPWIQSNESSDDDEGTEEEEEEEEEEDSDTEDEDGADDDSACTVDFNDEPGNDSGCTAVVALFKSPELYVANVGDSRCVLSRNGKAVDMSFDHKPEDEPEITRIKNAGGKVTADGRVNGGLNLSRAIGDHAYKNNKELSECQQMISPYPDVKQITVDPENDEFMILACDGIWNSMSSQEVVDFIKLRLDKEGQETLKLSSVCEELFDACLSDNTAGDGTGCDNMTAVIVQFKKQNDQNKQTMSGGLTKRPAEEIHQAPPSKKACVNKDQEASSS